MLIKIYQFLRFISFFRRFDKFFSKTLSTNKKDILEISTSVGCAMLCEYCPQEIHKINGKNIPKRLTIDVFKKVLDNIESKTRIHWTGYSEPLGNKYFPEFVEMVKKKGNFQLISTTMHGHANCIDFMKKTTSFSQITYHLPDDKNLMKLKVDNEYLSNLRDSIVSQSKYISKNIDILVIGDDFQVDVKKVINELLDQKILSISQIDIRKHLHTRSSQVKNFEGFYNSEIQKVDPQKKNKLFYCDKKRLNHGVLVPDGRISLCCHDYSLSFFQGDLKNNSLTNIYKQKQIYEENTNFITGKFYPCSKCEYYKYI
jgi:hypothetical protein